MKHINKILILISSVMVFAVYAGETDKGNTTNADSRKTVVNTVIKNTAVKSDTASKGVVPIKTNWSKIKDLFM